jgi:pimeloyl-ACP methyl ester carboxylesterase
VHIRINDSTVLRGWWLTPGNARGTIIVFCGLDEVIEQWTDRFNLFTTGLDMNVLAFDYRGFGYSSGKATFENMLTDALTIYDYLVSRPEWVPSLILLYGHSLGTGVEIHVADFRPVAGVMLESSFTTAARAVPYQRAVLPWPIRWFIRLKADKTLRDFRPQPVDEIAQMTAPALFIHGSKDKQTPLWMGREMFNADAGSMKYFCEVPGGGHDNLQINREPIAGCIDSFLDKLLTPTPNSKTSPPNVAK